MSSDNKPIANDIDANAVISFLKKNPNFIIDNPSVLNNVTLKHEVTGAESLLERQVKQLRKQQQKSQAMFEDMVEFAKSNEGILNKIRDLTVSTASAATPRKVFSKLHTVITENFELDSLHLVIEHSTWPMGANYVIALNGKELSYLKNILDNRKVVVGEPGKELLRLLSPTGNLQIESIAIVQFSYRQQDAFLLIGSRDADHFKEGMSTDFLEYIGQYIEALMIR